MSLAEIRHIWRLSAVRQTLWLLVLFCLISLLAWGGTYALVWFEMTKAVDQRLSSRMEFALAELQAQRPLPKPGNGQTVLLTKDEWPLGFQSNDVADGAGPDMRFLVRETPQGNIVLGESVEREENLRSILAGGMQITLVITLIASFAFSMVIAKRSQQRLDTISKGLKEVAAGHLDTEIVLDGTDDDLGMLVERINDTTARLARTMQQIRVQSSNIAHDLRTPLARLRAQLESSLDSLALKQQPVSQAALEDAIAQIDDIAEIFDALLRLARIQNGEGRARFETVDLAEFVREIADTYGPVVSDAGQKLLVSIDDANEISGDPKLLMQLVANLVQNAMRYGEKGQEINLVVHASKLSITDKGPGIPPQDSAKVLQALYQGETTRHGKGYGLGLAMVKAICDLHKAQLSLSSGPNEVGLTVAVQFPK